MYWTLTRIMVALRAVETATICNEITRFRIANSTLVLLQRVEFLCHFPWIHGLFSILIETNWPINLSFVGILILFIWLGINDSILFLGYSKQAIVYIDLILPEHHGTFVLFTFVSLKSIRFLITIKYTSSLCWCFLKVHY